MKRSSTVLAATLLLAPAWSGVVHAMNYLTPGTEKFKFLGGVGLNIYNSDLRISQTNLPIRKSISVEDDLNLDRTRPAAFLGGYWRFKRKHRLAFNYTRLRRSGASTLETDIEFVDDDGNAIRAEAGAMTTTEYEVDLTTLDYLYSFFNREQFELSASGGIYWTRISFELAVAGKLVINDEPKTSASSNVDLEVAAPLPAVGFRANFFLKPNWSLGSFGKLFYLELEGGDLKGGLWNVGFNTEYYFTKHVGIGGALTAFGLRADVKDGRTNADLEYTYLGPQIYLTGKF